LLTQAHLITPEDFLPFHEPTCDERKRSGYGGYSPSASYLKSHYLKAFRKREQWCFEIMQQIKGLHMKSDISYKVVKKAHVDGSRVFEGCLTIMNEHNQVSPYHDDGETTMMMVVMMMMMVVVVVVTTMMMMMMLYMVPFSVLPLSPTPRSCIIS
jgi:hypothetical protein